MNYINIYYNIILKAKLDKSRVKYKRNNSIKTYYESHHILPKSLSGDNSASNLVLLTAKEHFICHHLLFKHYSINGSIKEKAKMALAFQFMRGIKNNFSKRVTAKTYEEIRKAIQNNMIGKNNPMYGKPSYNKGKNLPLTENKKKAYKARRNNTEYCWVNFNTKEKVKMTIHELAKTYNLNKRHLYGVLNVKEDRTHVKGWYLKGTDPRNRHIRNTMQREHVFINIEKMYSVKMEVEDFINKYHLPYEEVRNIITFNARNTNYSYSGWTQYHTFSHRYEARFKKFYLKEYVLIDKNNNESCIKGTITKLAEQLGIQSKSKLYEMLQTQEKIKRRSKGIKGKWILKKQN